MKTRGYRIEDERWKLTRETTQGETSFPARAVRHRRRRDEAQSALERLSAEPRPTPPGNDLNLPAGRMMVQPSPLPAAARRRFRARSPWLGVAAIISLLSLGMLFAENYSIGWWTIDGGAGMSTGGVYAGIGTIGQPDAGSTAMTGGAFSVTGGFWALAAVQTSGAPLLSIARTATNTVAIRWPSPSTGWVLQQNTNSVASVNWSNVITTPLDDGTNKTVLVSPPTGNRFYRLFKP